MKDGRRLVIAAVIGLGLWAWRKAKPTAAISEAELARLLAEWEKASDAEKAKLQAQIAAVEKQLALKSTITETPSIALDTWQAVTPEQVKTLPVTQETGMAGVTPYYKTSEPVAIGDTGSFIWGMTESGAIVVATNEPATFDLRDWM